MTTIAIVAEAWNAERSTLRLSDLMVPAVLCEKLLMLFRDLY